MRTITALEAKNAFGQLLEAAQREPVAVTKNRRLVAAMFSMEDIKSMANAYLSPPLQDEVAAGTVGITSALIRQARINEHIARSREEVAAGKTHSMDEGFFHDLRDHVPTVSSEHDSRQGR